MSRRVRVAVVLGGRSSEHDISVASAQSVIESLDPARYEVVTVEIGRDGAWQMGSGQPALSGPVPEGHVPVPGTETGPTETGPSETLPVPASGGSVATTLAEVDVVFPVLHGPFGEDGTVQGLLELADVPYVGAGVLASAVCMDKDVFKAVMRDNDIPVTRNITLRLGDEARNPFGYPVFVKPARLGSSVGISKAHDEDELRAAVELAFRHDEKILVEEFVSGVEIEVGVLGAGANVRVSLPGEIVAHAEWYDYSAKYDEGGMELIVPARITEEQSARVQDLAHRAFVATECEGMVRADCFVRDDGEVLVNELNTIPGFTATSVYTRLFEASGVSYAEQLDRLVQVAIDRWERRKRLLF